MSRKYLLAFLFFASCAGESDSVYPEGAYRNIDNGRIVNASSFSEDDSEENRRFKAEIDLLNYLEPLAVDIEGRFVLDDSFEGGVELHAYTSSMVSPDGSYFKFSRSKTVEHAVDVHFYSRNFYEVSLCIIPHAYSVNGEFNLRVQYTNSLIAPNFAIWNLYEDADAPRRRSEQVFNLNTANCSSNINNNILVDLFGVGNSWGVVLNKIEVSKLVRRVPYDL